MLKKPTHHFLHFTRKEKNGTLFLLFIISILIATPFIYSLIFKQDPPKTNQFINELAALKLKSADSAKNNYADSGFRPRSFSQSSKFDNNNYDALPISLFYFDPNTIAESGWKKLGLRDKTITSIKKYLSKGGRFREAGDLKKIWGLSEEHVNKLLPYVKIPQPAFSSAQTNYKPYEKKEYPKKEITVVDINAADSITYLSLPGIGPGYARRIIKYRDRLGGFYKTEQLAETFGLPDSTFQKIKGYIKISGDNIKKININVATLDELKQHPYIKYQLANSIIEFRNQHGNFSSVEDIKKMMLMTDEVFAKLAPYLDVK